MEEQALWQVPSRTAALSFWLRSRGLMLRRALQDFAEVSLRRLPPSGVLANGAIVSEHRSPLWDDDRPQEEWPLLAGKVHNLRRAVSAFDGVMVPAGAVLSFWKQLGRPSVGRGFVLGREVRNGCVVPTLGGGLCQLSNALATCASKAGLRLVERHAHSRLPSRLGADVVDATLFWNYVDLRLQSDAAWRIEATLSADELIVRVRMERNLKLRDRPVEPPTSRDTSPSMVDAAPRSCLGCNETTCFRHRPAPPNPPKGRTAALLDTWTPEFERHLAESAGGIDFFVPRSPRWLGLPVPGRTSWRITKPAHVGWGAFVRRSLWCRLNNRWQSRRQAAVIEGAGWLARSYAGKLRPEHTQLIVDQALVPHLHGLGVLQGRRFTVLAHGLPMREIQERLDRAAHRWPDEPSLRDFRVDPALSALELDAWRSASAIVTPHRAAAEFAFRHTGRPATMLDWVVPAVATRRPRAAAHSGVIAFAGSALARKGSREFAEAARQAGRRAWLLGSMPADATPWEGIDWMHAGYRSDWVEQATVVVLPAHVEHSPRAVLTAIAHGIPVVVTPACGLHAMPGVTIVPPGDPVALRAAIDRAYETIAAYEGHQTP